MPCYPEHTEDSTDRRLNHQNNVKVAKPLAKGHVRVVAHPHVKEIWTDGEEHPFVTEHLQEEEDNVSCK